MNMIQKAKEIATVAHESQTRKNSGDAYIVHPTRVAKMVERHGGTDEMIAASWLHDVKEDCPEFIGEIDKTMPREVLKLVDELTKPESMNKFKWLRSFVNASQEAIIIKMADRFDNLLDPAPMGQEWLKNYLEQTAIILKNAKRNGLETHGIYRELENRYFDLHDSINKRGSHTEVM